MKNEGIIKKVISDRGFGFIKGEDKDYFFHFSNMVDTKRFEHLMAGSKVKFNIEQDKRNRDIAIEIEEM